MQAARRALRLVFAPSKAWAAIAAERSTERSGLTGHALLLFVPFLAFFALQLAIGGLHPDVTVSGQARFRMDGSQIGSGSNVTLSLSGSQTALLLCALCLVGGALMYWLVLSNAESYGAVPDRTAALRLVLYAMTPAVIGSLLYAVPLIGWLLAILGYILTVRLFRRGAPVLLPPLVDETGRFGRVIGRRAAILGLVLPVLAFIGGAIAFSARFVPPAMPGMST